MKASPAKPWFPSGDPQHPTPESTKPADAASWMLQFLVQPSQMLGAFEAARQELGNHTALLWARLEDLRVRLRLFAGVIANDTPPDALWPEGHTSHASLRRMTTEALIQAIEAQDLDRIELAFWRWQAVMTEPYFIEGYHDRVTKTKAMAKEGDRNGVQRVLLKMAFRGNALVSTSQDVEHLVSKKFLQAFRSSYEREHGTTRGWKKAATVLKMAKGKPLTEYRINQLVPESKRLVTPKVSA